MSHETATQTSSQSNSEVVQEILRAIDQLRQGSGYGSVEITVHESRVTQIERREKVRFAQANGQEAQRIKPTATAAAAL